MALYVGGTGTANQLDDYEEGTWTPTDASGAGLTITSNYNAVYTKVGRFVYVQFDVTWASNSNNATAALGNLPFTQADRYGTGVVGWNDRDNPAGIVCHVGSSSQLYMMDNTSASSSSGAHLLNSELSNKRAIGIAFYQAAT